jgi:hypothetical protein
LSDKATDLDRTERKWLGVGVSTVNSMLVVNSYNPPRKVWKIFILRDNGRWYPTDMEYASKTEADDAAEIELSLQHTSKIYRTHPELPRFVFGAWQVVMDWESREILKPGRLIGLPGGGYTGRGRDPIRFK